MNHTRPSKRFRLAHDRWHDVASPRRPISPSAASWIELRTSLTARLAAHTHAPVRVHVLSERRDRFLASERDLLGTHSRFGRVREVRLEAEGVTYVVARTVFPLATARGANRGLMRLGNRALGSLLFGALRAPASQRQYALLNPRSELWRVLKNDLPTDARQLWARRALHSLKGRPLIVTEILLPGLLSPSS